MSHVAYLEDGPSVLSLYEGFFAGGARILHTAVVRALDATTPQHHSVLSLSDRVQREFTAQRISGDNSYRRLTRAGVPVRALRRTPTGPISAGQLARVQRTVARADVVLSLKEQPLTVLGRVGTSGTPLIVCLHRSDPEHQGAGVQELVDLDRAGLLTAAVCCAESTQRAYHEATGIPLERLPVVPNGVDLYKFRTSGSLRAEKRAELGVTGDEPVVMIAARFDAMKNIPLFVRAAARFVAEHPSTHLVMCGAGMTPDNPALAELIAEEMGWWANLGTNLHALGIQSQMAPLYNAADLITLTSAFGEAAPLCLLEGMA
ncbi:MAG: glycosyltransferase, partial [Nocardioides sp.]|nr:glycosyltransferase [Nocardioides sp.]